jgi:hypothetical protein
MGKVSCVVFVDVVLFAIDASLVIGRELKAAGTLFVFI